MCRPWCWIYVFFFFFNSYCNQHFFNNNDKKNINLFLWRADLPLKINIIFYLAKGRRCCNFVGTVFFFFFILEVGPGQSSSFDHPGGPNYRLTPPIWASGHVGCACHSQTSNFTTVDLLKSTKLPSCTCTNADKKDARQKNLYHKIQLFFTEWKLSCISYFGGGYPIKIYSSYYPHMKKKRANCCCCCGSTTLKVSQEVDFILTFRSAWWIANQWPQIF